jgi:hypothetical protein
MPLTGQEKKDHNFIRYRLDGKENINAQLKFWPGFVKAWDEEAKGVRYKSEVLSLSDLWLLYLGDADLSPDAEEKARGKKPSKDRQIQPVMERRIPGPYSDEGYLHFDQWLRARDKARKDLYWLGKEILHADFVPNTHKVVCNQFVQPDFDGAFPEGYSLKDLQPVFARQNRVPRIWVETGEYEPRTLKDFGKYILDPNEVEDKSNYARTMILMDPRGFFKSTIDGIHCIQLIINCPDVRILIMSGVYKLALQFLVGIKTRFYLPRGQHPSTFHLLFPEYVVRGIDGDSKEPLTCPARVHESITHDPTLGIISIGSSLSGFHCDFLKFDDVVTDDNCLTEETREALREKADSATNLLMAWGWMDIIGTRYFNDDYYGLKLIKHEEDPEEYPLKFFKRASWIVKPGFEDKHIKDLTEEMVWLTFPEQETWKKLRKALKDNEKLFRCQQLNEPAMDDDGFKLQFTEELLMAHIMTPENARKKIDGEIFISCDPARVTSKYSDYSVLVAGRTFKKDDGQVALVLLEVSYNHWTQSQLAYRIAEFCNKWFPSRTIIIEDTGGLDLLKLEIQKQSQIQFGRNITNIYWKRPENDRNAKRNRIKTLEILLKNDQLYFGFAGEALDETFRQFINYKGQVSGARKKDDIPDACSFLPRFLPFMQIQLTPREQEEKYKMEEQENIRRALADAYKMHFGGNQQARVEPELVAPPEPPPSPMDKAIKNLGLGRMFGRNE